MAAPPTPVMVTRSPARARIAAINWAPSWSPDGSPQTSINVLPVTA
jgi:hypothetical protein